ncbi:MAG: hypothetical protein ACOYOV_12330 [Bacteroidales bacterium]
MALQKDYSQNLIKARVAETIIQELFFDNNYNVYNYGMERTMPTLIGKIYRDKSDVSTAIRTMPDFVIQHLHTGELFYVEVKFRASGNFTIKDLLVNFPYENAHFIIVSKNAIKCISYKELKEGKSITKEDNRHLADYTYFKLKPESVKRFMKYVNDFFLFVK